MVTPYQKLDCGANFFRAKDVVVARLYACLHYISQYLNCSGRYLGAGRSLVGQGRCDR